MRRFLGLSLAVIALGSISGCGGSASGSSASSTIATLAASVAALKELDGQYAFLLTGFDHSGVPMAIAGAIAADGNGHITAGAVDVNDNQVVSSTSAVTGAYTTDVNSRGIISFVTAVGAVPSPLAFAFTLRTDGTFATLIGFDNNNFVISGTMQKQDTTAFSLAALAGSFIYETDSHMPAQTSEIGRFQLGVGGAITLGVDDASVAGTGPALTKNSSFVAQYNAPAANGRGTGFMTENGPQKNFAYYIINASKFIAIETDVANVSITLDTTVATKQASPPPATATTAGSVFAVTGLDTTITRTISAVGQIVIPSSTPQTANFTWDSNDAGTISGPALTGSATVVYDASTGRGTITALNQAVSGGLFDSAVFYLSGPGTGYILDTTASTNNRALAGALTQQTGSFSNASISANAIGYTTTGNSVGDPDSAADLLFAVNTSNNTISGIQDVTFAGSETPGSSFIGLALGTVNAASGRNTITLSTSLGAVTYALYLIAPNQYVFINTTPAEISPLFLFSPQ